MTMRWRSPSFPLTAKCCCMMATTADIPYRYRREGFDNGYLKDDNDLWRFLWLNSADGKYRIVVGQEWDYREDMALAIVAAQLTPWLIALPFMLLILLLLLHRELRPLKNWRRRYASGRRNRKRRSTPKAYRARFAHWSKRLISF